MIKRYYLLLKVFMKNCIIRDLEFRMNFVTNLLTDFVFNILKIFFIELIFLNTPEVAGFNKYQMIFIFGTSFIILSVYMTFVFFNHIRIPMAIQNGEFDFALVKPMSTVFLLSFRYFNIAGIGSGLFGIYLVGLSFYKLNMQFDILSVVLYLVLLISGFLVYYSLSLILYTFSFWTVKTGNFINVMVDMGEIMKYPVGLFPKSVQLILSFIVPLFMVASYPSAIFLGKLPTSFTIINLLVSLVFLSISISFIRYASKCYSSAGG
ncbi:ABC transporter permease [Paenibacillus piscarius]|uniref:ABC transporter permease n=1 Tax=Paenibacillus piscarius TaxID=1089681 RepID=UPI001EE7AF1B